MNFRQIIKNSISLFQKKESPQIEELEEELQEDIPNKTLRQEKKKTSLRPPLPEIKGIRKRTAYIVIGLFITVFFISLYFSLSQRSSSTTKRMTAQHEAATPNSGSGLDKYPNSYEDLGKLNAKAKASNNQEGINRQSKNQGQTNSQNQNTYGEVDNPYYYDQSNTSLRRSIIPNSSGRSNAVYPESYQDKHTVPPDGRTLPTAGNKEDPYKSSIRFAIDGFLANPLTANSASTAVTTASPTIYKRADPFVLQQGAVIPALLITGIDSDLPGQVIAQVQENVYDSLTGNYLLIPQGSRLIGNVSKNAIGTGQERIGVTWNRLLLPNGDSIDLGGMEGIDKSGYTGLKDRVDNHTGKIVGATLLSSLLAAGAQIASGNTDGGNETSGQLIVSGAATAVLNAGAKILDKSININPTIRIRPGIAFYVFMNKDMILRPYEGD